MRVPFRVQTTLLFEPQPSECLESEPKSPEGTVFKGMPSSTHVSQECGQLLTGRRQRFALS